MSSRQEHRSALPPATRRRRHAPGAEYPSRVTPRGVHAKHNIDLGISYAAGVRSFLRGVVQLHVLHHAAEREVNGAWMAAELARHGHHISPGTLYPTLHRMEQEGLLRSRQATVQGRRQRLYTATRQGKQTLKRARQALRELTDELLED